MDELVRRFERATAPGEDRVLAGAVIASASSSGKSHAQNHLDSGKTNKMCRTNVSSAFLQGIHSYEPLEPQASTTMQNRSRLRISCGWRRVRSYRRL